MRRWLIPLLFLLLGIITYFPSLSGSLFWDDNDFIRENRYVKEFRVDKFFSSQAVEGSGKVSNYFRPIQFTVYATIYHFVGPSPIAFHAMSIFIHIAASLAVYAFLVTLGLPSIIGLTTSFFFLVHPVQTEAVAYVSGLSDPLVTFFGFLSLSTFLLFVRSKTPHYALLAISYALFLLTLLSKESGVIFLGLLLFLSLWYAWQGKKPFVFILATLIPFAAILLFYLLYHHQLIDVVDMATIWGASPYANSVFVRLAMFFSLIPRYVFLLLFPKDLFYDRDFTLNILTSPWNLSAFLVLSIGTVCISVLFYNFMKQKTKQSFFLLFSFCSFFIAFIPFSGLVLINGIFYEHFLYIPLVFFFLFFFLIINRCLPKKTPPLLLLAYFLVLSLLIFRSWARQREWQTPIPFYLQTLSHAPRSFRIWNNLGMSYDAQGQEKQAINAFTHTITLNPQLPNAYHNLGNIYLKQGNFTQAEHYFLKAIAVDPNFGYSYAALLTLYQKTGNPEKISKISQEITRRFK